MRQDHTGPLPLSLSFSLSYLTSSHPHTSMRARTHTSTHARTHAHTHADTHAHTHMFAESALSYTQVPQAYFDYQVAMGRGGQCNCVVTQPRRVSGTQFTSFAGTRVQILTQLEDSDFRCGACCSGASRAYRRHCWLPDSPRVGHCLNSALMEPEKSLKSALKLILP